MSVVNLPAVQNTRIVDQQPVPVSNFPAQQKVNVVNDYLYVGAQAGKFDDGSDVTIGSTGHIAATNATGSWTVVSILKGILARLLSNLSVSVTNFPAIQPVSGALSITNFPPTQPVSGTVSVNNFPALQPVSVSNFPPTQPVSGTVAVSNFPNPQNVLEKKDTGRQQLFLSWENIVGSVAESALVNFTSGSRGAAALPVAGFYTVSGGKTLRLQTVSFLFGQNGSSACNYRARLRQGNPVTNASPVILGAGAGGPSNTANPVAVPIPDGLELAAGQQLGLTHIDTAAGGVFSVYLTGFEY